MRRPPPLSSSKKIIAAEASGGNGCRSGKVGLTRCCSNVGFKRRPWTAEEDELLVEYINREGEGRWRTLPKKAGLLRCGKSCCLRWMNYLCPSVKRGNVTPDEEDLILRLHCLLGNRWSLIAGRIPGRTDNEIKNYWNTHLSKKLISYGIYTKTRKQLKPPNKDSSLEALDDQYNSSVSKPNNLVPFDPIVNVVINNAQRDDETTVPPISMNKECRNSYEGMISCQQDEDGDDGDQLLLRG